MRKSSQPQSKKLSTIEMLRLEQPSTFLPIIHCNSAAFQQRTRARPFSKVGEFGCARFVVGGCSALERTQTSFLLSPHTHTHAPASPSPLAHAHQQPKLTTHAHARHHRHTHTESTYSEPCRCHQQHTHAPTSSLNTYITSYYPPISGSEAALLSPAPPAGAPPLDASAILSPLRRPSPSRSGYTHCARPVLVRTTLLHQVADTGEFSKQPATLETQTQT